MFSPVRRHCWQAVTPAVRSGPSTAPLPFLVPALHLPSSARPFSASSSRPSHLARTPISLPPEVNLQLVEPPAPKNHDRVGRKEPNKVVKVQGPLGEMKMEIPPFLSIDHDVEARKVLVKVHDAEERRQREMWGTTRAYLQNHVLGVSEGHTAILRLVGVGYRATVEDTAVTKSAEYEGQQFVVLRVGYSHPIELGVPRGVKASTPQPTRILLEGTEKEVVNQFAAEIRMWRKPEPYKGKGIFVNGETITLKAKKIK